MWHKITLAGNLGRDPEMRYMQDGTAVTNFSVAVNDGYGDNKKTIWVRVSVWGKRAEVANQYLTKGSKILVEGRLRTDANGNPQTWTAQDGTVRANYEVTATDFAFIGSRGDSEGYNGPSDDDDGPGYSGGGNSGGGGSSRASQPAVEEDDIPF
jgi:single-strand DNA-binding protein